MPEQQIRLEQVKDQNSNNLLVLLDNVNANTANANTAASLAAAAANVANTIANVANTTATLAYGHANDAYVIANTANATANLALPIAGGTITGNLTVLEDCFISGDLVVAGNLIVGNTITANTMIANTITVTVIQGFPYVSILNLGAVNSIRDPDS